MKALLAWELGGGQGHIHRLAFIAQLLENEGIEPIFALKSDNCLELNLPWKILQAPIPLMKILDKPEDTRAYLFTDILYMFGFGDSLTLHFQIQAWQNLINLVQPNLVIADFAPTLVLAISEQIPTLVIGNEFTVPPPINHFPPIRQTVPIASIHRQSQVIETVMQVTSKSISLGQLLNGDCALIFSIPELDLYQKERYQPEYVGIQNAPFPTDCADELGRSWSYLSYDYPYYDLVMKTIKPQYEFGKLKKILLKKSVAIHHGGSTTSIACLLAGIPQIILPKYQEQALRAEALEKLGVARVIQHPTVDSLKETMTSMSTLFHQAQKWQQDNRSWNDNFVAPRIQSWIQTIKSKKKLGGVQNERKLI